MDKIGQIEFWLSLIVLLGINFLSLRRLSALKIDEKIYIALICLWSSLILSALSLSLVNLFGSNHLFVAVSIFFQILLSVMVYLGYRNLNAIEPPNFRLWFKDSFSTWQRKLIIPFAFLLTSMIGYMAFHLPLGISDSLAIKLPNAFFYLEKGNLLSATELAADGRLFSTPFNGTILWSYLIRWHQPTSLILILNFLFWALSLVCVYRISRALKASRWGSITAACFWAFSICLLFQGSSDNDDLMSSISALCGCVFFLRWIASTRLIDMILAALGLGISLGCKMFPGLYAPAMIILFVSFCLTNRKQNLKEFVRRTMHLSLAAVICAGFILPYCWANLNRFGKFSLQTPLLAGIMNRPFSFEVAWHNIVVYNMQAILSPLIDSFFSSPGPLRDQIVPPVNKFLVDSFVPHVKTAYAYASELNIVHRYLYYNTVWYGLVADLLLIYFCVLAWRARQKKSPAFWFAVFFICWDIVFCVRGKYIEELGRYWVLAFGLAIPTVALMWDEVQAGAFGKWNRFLKISFVVVWITTFLAGYHGITRDAVRFNFRQVWKKEIIRQDILSPNLLSVLRTCDNLNVTFRVYGYPIITLLHEFTGKRITYNWAAEPEQNLIVTGLKSYLRETFYEHKYVAVDLHNPDLAGFKYLDQPYGVALYGEAMKDCRCASLCGANKSLLLVELSPQFSEEHETLPVLVQVMNRHLDSQYVFMSLAINQSGKDTILSDWSDAPSWSIKILPDVVSIEIRVMKKSDLKMDIGERQIYKEIYPVQKPI